MPSLPQTVIEQDFKATLPESFEKKVITTMTAEDLADQKMMLKFYRLWRQEARQEAKALKEFIIFLESKGEQTNQLLIGAGIDEKWLDELQAMIDEYNQAYEEYKEQEELARSYTDEINELNTELSSSIESLFEDNTNFASDGVKASKKEQEKYLNEMDKQVKQHAEQLAEKNQTDIEPDFAIFFKILADALNNAPELKQANASSVKKAQITAKIIGKEGDKHHSLHKKKFQAACKKAICLQRMRSLQADLSELSSKSVNSANVNSLPLSPASAKGRG